MTASQQPPFAEVRDFVNLNFARHLESAETLTADIDGSCQRCHERTCDHSQRPALGLGCGRGIFRIWPAAGKHLRAFRDSSAESEFSRVS